MAETLLTRAALDGSGPRSDAAVLRSYDLYKRYGQRLAVKALNLEVRRGEIFGFLGPNGAGKTTTIRMMLGLITPTAGRVEVLGQDIAEQKARVLPRVGALIETPALHLYMSGRNNLRAMGAILGGVAPGRIDAVLDMVGLRERQHDRVKTYSLGMKQRLGVAIALLNDPDLLILDEPANGLDPAGIVEMRDLMRRLVAEGKTIFLSSHVLTEVQQICTRVAIINLGQLVTESTIEGLTGGQGRFAVKLDEAAQALARIQAQPWGAGATLDDHGALLTPSPDGRGRTLNRFLVEAGFYPDSLSPYQESLEEVFLRLTTGDERGVH
ncbi:MAG TPA: ABC transporter ATP-binding protein [Ktedonobacterales bacterium]|nr:ABC transporter ATP-binding protein [Ktedonobacterales bacterium]